MVSVRVAKLADKIDCADCPLTVNYPACREFPHLQNGRLSVDVFPMLNSRTEDTRNDH